MRPILILQMQRMGDLILTWPLVLQLSRTHPGRPVWVVAERTFFDPLLPLSPPCAYIDWRDANTLSKHRFHTIINLSHRPEAAELAARLSAHNGADEVLGPVQAEGQPLHIRGDWHLYRASLTHANRHNRYHWTDLNALDAVPASTIAATRLPAPRRLDATTTSVGVFIGASEPHKRPDTTFWIRLVEGLFARRLGPVLLGGPAEAAEGAAIARHFGSKVLNLCGTTSLDDMARLGQTVQLFITPDTGPMHLAAWTGVQVLNLSTGPVHPWETGPRNPGHLVVRGAVSCGPCWQCSRVGEEVTPPCVECLDADAVAALARRVVASPHKPLSHGPRGLLLYRTDSDARGLFDLRPVGPSRSRSVHHALGTFWKGAFGAIFGLHDETDMQQAVRELAAMPGGETVRQRLLASGPALAEVSRDKRQWTTVAPLARPFASWAAMYMDNAGHTPAARARVLDALQRVLSVVAATE